MGQGAESCGAYEWECDTYEEEMPNGYWTERSGGKVHVSKMSERHLKNTIRICESASRRANFSCDSDKWNDWIEILNGELSRRKPAKNKKIVTDKPKQLPRGAKVNLQCHCGNKYQARQADLNRGWGRSCSKRCAAIKRDFGRDDPILLK